ncbi:MAG: RHS repeat-associated core domain-containing protein [Ruminococcaceae bacterium]|nr:RHS repeat-associated core domain-containing protein [Oscillospiraceae bacterium]
MRLFLDKHLDKNTKFCYTYDELSRVTARTVKKLSDNSVVSTETFTYDAAGNITDAPESCFQYDTNNRLIIFNGNAVTYDPDGNMLSNSSLSCTYDSANRLITAGGHTYTYNAEDVRIRNLCESEDTTYTYNTNAKLSMLLMKTTGGVVTKYVYGKGLIGEETNNAFKTYHFDCRGSTIAITDVSGNITDTFAYDTYGKLISRTGTSNVIFGYNGRDGVVTDDNGLIYMRARYYSPEMKRFVNADVIAGAISNAITLNRFAYANGNPVSLVDPFGLSPERENNTESTNTVDRISYITSYMENTDNALYILSKSWGISLTKTAYETSDYIDMFWGGFSVKLHVDVSFATPLETDVVSDISADSGYATEFEI